MIRQVVLLAVGLALIIKGGDLFVSASVRIAELLRMPRVVIGSTLVSLATTSPELVVSITAGLRGESGLAIGNAVGSSVCNIALILGVTAALKHVHVHPAALRTAVGAMLGAALMLSVLTLDLYLSRVEGAALVLVGLAYLGYDFRVHWRDTRAADVAEATAIEREMVAARGWHRTRRGTAAQFLAGAAMVVVGSRLLVDSAVAIAGALAVPPLIIGLTVVAAGTSLPELVTAVTSSRQDVSDLGVGNVLGANIANLSLIAGAAAVIDPIPLDRVTQLFNFPAMLILMALCAYLLLRRGRVTRGAGAALLGYYALYLLGVIAVTALAW